MNTREWLRLKYEFTYMDDENGALGLRKRVSAAAAAFGGGKADETPFERLSVALPSILAHMRAEGVVGGKAAVTQACHSIGIDQESKDLEDRRLFREQNRT